MPTTLNCSVNTARATTRMKVKVVPNQSYGSKLGPNIPGSKKAQKHLSPRNVDLYKSGRKHPHKLLLINDDSQFLAQENVEGNKKHLSPCSDPLLLPASACTMNKLAWFSMCFLLRKSCSSVNLQCKSTPMYIVHFTTLPRVQVQITCTCATSSIKL